MDCISAREAAERWNISMRRVQMLCEHGRIPGAHRWGRSWTIPADAQKPADPRREKPPQYSLDADLLDMIAATLVPMPEDHPDAILDTFDEDRLRLQYESELAYLRGDFQRVMQCYARTVNDEAARLRACSVTIAAAISLGDYDAYAGVESWLKKLIAKQKDSVSAVVAELALAVAAVSAIAPNMAPEWLKAGDFSAIPIQARPDAAYKRAKYFLCVGNYEAALATARTALSFCEAKRGVAYADIYLKLTCAVSLCALERIEESRIFLLETMKIALPYGFVTPFAEMVTAFGGMLEQCLEQAYPAYYDAVTRQWKRVFKNWLEFHNRFTKAHITRILSMREYETAQLAARRTPYEKIAEQQCVTVGTVRNTMRKVYAKLCISSRDELAEYII